MIYTFRFLYFGVCFLILNPFGFSQENLISKSQENRLQIEKIPGNQNTVSIFSCQTPSVVDFTENRPYELGLKFKSSKNGRIVGIRYWKATSESGIHIGRIWNQEGIELTNSEFKKESNSGWQTQLLQTPLSILKDSIYIVSVNVNTHYVASQQELSTVIYNCPLMTIADSKNGVYGDRGSFPSNSFANSNYFRDLLFSPSDIDSCLSSKVFSNQFIHRGYLGWIHDLASSPRPNDNWPSIWIDEELIQDYENTFQLMQKIGLNEISIWGLFAARSWPLDIEHAIDSFRSVQILRILESAHHYKIKVLAGLGVYSWGFDEIIRANPNLGCSHNASIICPNNSDAWNWQKRMLDYIFSFPIDGISMQSADLGRCRDCKELDTISDMSYHAIVNDRVAEYVKQTYPEKLVGVNTYGMNLGNPQELQAIKKLTRNADYLIDVNNTALNGGSTHVCNIVHSIAPTSYGNLGTPGIEPPMHWARDRWFLPMIKRRSQTLLDFFNKGARAVENYMHLVKNPGEEVSLILVAALENDPNLNWESELKRIVDEIYLPEDSLVLEKLSALFIHAEDIYFKQVGVSQIISLEPLVSSTAGPPIYIRDRMTLQGMLEYKEDLCILRQEFLNLKPKIANTDRLDIILKCIENTVNDISILTNNASNCKLVKSENESVSKEALKLNCVHSETPGIIEVEVWNGNRSQDAILKLTSANGVLLSKVKIPILQGQNSYFIEVDTKSSQIYFIQIEDPINNTFEYCKVFMK
ncbi:MAG: DUF4082 domain-containing protein [Saprospiraceae bacterium]